MKTVEILEIEKYGKGREIEAQRLRNRQNMLCRTETVNQVHTLLPLNLFS